MITSTEKPGTGFERDNQDDTRVGPILAAVDGTPAGEWVLTAAATLARHSGAEVVVLTVLAGLPLIAADYGMVIPPIDSDDARRRALLARVKAQVAKIGAEAGDWRIELREGDPAAR